MGSTKFPTKFPTKFAIKFTTKVHLIRMTQTTSMYGGRLSALAVVYEPGKGTDASVSAPLTPVTLTDRSTLWVCVAAPPVLPDVVLPRRNRLLLLRFGMTWPLNTLP